MEAEALPVNPVLIIVIVITAVLVYGLSWVFVIQMVHPDDKNQAWVSKVFAVRSSISIASTDGTKD